MDARLTPEQHALRDTAAQVVERHGPRAVGQLDDVERATKLDAAVAAAGWREMRADSGDGSPWASAVEVAIVAEELGRGLADAPFVGPTLAAELRRLAGAPAAPKSETVVLDESLTGLASVAPAPGPAGGVAIDAAWCTSALLLLPAEHGHDVGQVEIANPQVAIDLTRPAARVDPRGGQRLELTRPITDDSLTRWNALALAVTCADLVGTMRGATAQATEYARSRRQYGTSIGSFQAVQHLLADALVATEGSYSATLHAGWSVDALSSEDALAAAAVAKAYCSRAARMVCETSIQVHGGIGNTWECLAHVYLRRALLSIDMLGGAGTNIARVLAHHGLGGDDGLR